MHKHIFIIKNRPQYRSQDMNDQLRCSTKMTEWKRSGHFNSKAPTGKIIVATKRLTRTCVREGNHDSKKGDQEEDDVNLV